MRISVSLRDFLGASTADAYGGVVNARLKASTLMLLQMWRS
jgi:hypothetical protein